MSWLRTLGLRYARHEVARFVAIATLVLFGIQAILAFDKSRSEGSQAGTSLGADYGQFHVAGMIQNQLGIGRLYDLDLQDRLLHQAVPGMPAKEHLPFVYPPWLAVPFRVLANLPYRGSFATWLAITAALYAAAVGTALSRCGAMTPADRATAWWLALSFEPFVAECWLGGQLSAIGCLAVSIALVCHSRGNRTGMGAALSVLCYKPTLLVLIVPMLTLGRQWRVLLGLAAGLATLAIVSLAVAGSTVCLEFVDLMRTYGRSGGSAGGVFRTNKYVDIVAFFKLLGLQLSTARALGFVVAVPILTALGRAWWRVDAVPRLRTDLLWGSTLFLTPVLNLYGPVYDVIIAVPGLLLAANAIRSEHPEAWPDRFRLLLLLLYLGAFFSPVLASRFQLQALTPCLVAMGLYLLWTARVSEPGRAGLAAAR